MDDDVLLVPEVARMLGVSQTTVCNLARRRQLPAAKNADGMWTFLSHEVELFAGDYDGTKRPGVKRGDVAAFADNDFHRPIGKAARKRRGRKGKPKWKCVQDQIDAACAGIIGVTHLNVLGEVIES